MGVNLLGRLSQVIEEHDEGPLFYLDMVRRGFSLWGYVWLLAYGWGMRQAWHYRDCRMWLLLSWVAGPLVLFSIAQTKLGNYITGPDIDSYSLGCPVIDYDA